MIAFIDEHRDRFGVEAICRVLSATDCGFITSRGYRAAKRRPASARALRDELLLEELTRIHAENYSVYGVRKMHHAMHRAGWEIGRDQVARLMKLAGLQGVRRGRKPVTTRPARQPDHRPDLVERRFEAELPHQLWVADITYVRTLAGFCYVAFITDVFTRRIVGWAVSTSLHTAGLPLLALEHALLSTGTSRGRQGLVHHSDRGAQGGFNRSSQHPLMEVLSGSSSAGSRSCNPAQAPVAGTSEVPASCRGCILGRDRQGFAAHRSRCGGRRGAGGRSAVVPPRWRHAAVRSEVQAHGQVPLLR